MALTPQSAHLGPATEPHPDADGRARPLYLVALLYGLLLVAFILLYVNYPVGYDSPYRLHLRSIDIFRRQWWYPTWPIAPAIFATSSAVTLVLLWLAYVGGIAVVGSGDSPRRINVVLGTTAVFGITLALFLPPVLSSDVYHYGLYGRLSALYGLNPYNVPPDIAGNDPFRHLAVWRDTTTQYGATWPLLSGLVCRLGASSVIATVIGFKLMAAAFQVLGALALVGLARRLRITQVTRVAVLFAWNPAALIESAGSGHNDVVMIALALMGALLLFRDRWFGAGILMMASFLVKYLTGILFAFALLALWKTTASERRREALVTMSGAALLTAIVLYAPSFWGLNRTSQLLRGLSPAINPILNHFGEALRSVIAAVLGPEVADGGGTSVVLNLSFAAILLAQARRVWRASEPWQAAFQHFAIAALLYTYVFFGGGFPWYLVSPAAAATLAPERARFMLFAIIIGLGLGFMLPYTVLIQGQ